MEKRMSNARPLIGITMRVEYQSERFYLARHYSEAVEAAGGDPVHISLIPRPDYISSVIESLDGVLLPGSDSDVNPMLYGRQPHHELGSVHPIKDETDLLVLSHAEARGIPVLAICFGLQSLNVSRGGTLIQDIRSQVQHSIQHQQGAPRDRLSHGVSLLEDSRLHRYAGALEARVNSHHHQAVEKAGRDLVETAWSPDGLIEGLEDARPERWVVGVQWHPEIAWPKDEFSKQLFNAFVNEAQIFKGLTEAAHSPAF
jgi:putative glutamine amidotransferase